MVRNAKFFRSAPKTEPATARSKNFHKDSGLASNYQNVYTLLRLQHNLNLPSSDLCLDLRATLRREPLNRHTRSTHLTLPNPRQRCPRVPEVYSSVFVNHFRFRSLEAGVEGVALLQILGRVLQNPLISLSAQPSSLARIMDGHNPSREETESATRTKIDLP